MNRFIQSRYFGFYTLVLVLLFGSIIFITLISVSQFKTTNQATSPSPTPVVSQTIRNRFSQVLQVTPQDYELLTPEKPNTFTVVFAVAKNPANLQVSLRQSPLLEPTKKEEVPITTEYNVDTETLVIRTTTALLPQSNYDLSVTDSNERRILLQLRYHSQQLLPTPVPRNNLTLKPYLPHDTESYRLVYNELRNVYIFNLKLETTSPDTFDDQFEKAKAEAIQFIQSKGIDPKTLVIEYRRS